ncbi:ABC transporter substrate-binding protein [Chlamydia sp. 17-3921]|uniref:ABC transporter substrate-binding protein n=1 Tax=Chlamydia sp. 17-3921 TaxID=2675798 RepID=UPI001919C858|nr:ABC transporter substrate-binding protein [Chlamydia sp. 17-3921]
MSILWILVILTSSLLSGCFFSQTHSSSSHLNIAIYADPILSPAQARKAQDLSLAKLLFEGLLRENPEKKDFIEFALASSYTSDKEHKKYTFYLKDNVLWSDGTPITSQDILEAWEYSQAHTIHYKIFQGLSFYASSATSVTVISDTPNPDLPKLLAFPAFFIYKPLNSRIFSGPFVIKEYTPSQNLFLTKNPYYYDFNAVVIDSIQLTVLPDIHTAKHLMTRGKIHWVGQPWHQGIPKEFLAHSKSLYYSYPVEGTFWLALNIKAPQLTNLANRLRIAAAINKSALIQEALEGRQQPAYSLSKGSTKFTTYTQQSQPTFLENITLTLTYPIEIIRCQRIAEVLREQLKPKGIHLHLEGLEYHCFLNKRNLYDYVITTQTEVAHYPNAHLQPNERHKLCNIEVIPLYHMHYDYLSSRPIKNVLYNASGAVDLKYAFLG